MKELVQERKAEARGEDAENAVLGKIAEMPEPDRAMAERLHAIVKASAPALSPKTWYGMPAYAKDGKVVCFFQSAAKFKARYVTLGFSDQANLDHGNMWPIYFALKELTCRGEEDRRACEEGGQLSAVPRLVTLRLTPARQMRILCATGISPRRRSSTRPPRQCARGPTSVRPASLPPRCPARQP